MTCCPHLELSSHTRPVLGPRGLFKDQLQIPFRKTSNLYFVATVICQYKIFCVFGEFTAFRFVSVALGEKNFLILKTAGHSYLLLEGVPHASD